MLASFRPQLNIDNYSGLVILCDEVLATPEAMAYFTNYLKTLQVSAVATNLQYVQTPSATQDLCTRALIEAGVKHRYFFDSMNANSRLRHCMSVPR